MTEETLPGGSFVSPCIVDDISEESPSNLDSSDSVNTTLLGQEGTASGKEAYTKPVMLFASAMDSQMMTGGDAAVKVKLSAWQAG